MPARWIRVDPAAALREGFEAIRREAGVPERFGAEAQAEAETTATAGPSAAVDRIDLPFVTIDPPGSRDLDQALHIARRGDGHRVSYAIADVGAFVAPGGALDRESNERAVTVYAPDRKAPLHPPVLSEGAASLLPGEWRPAVLWTIDLDARGEPTSTEVARAQVRSTAQHTYEDVAGDVRAVLAEVGERRMALERERGGVRLNVPEQEVVRKDGSWTVHYRVPLATEDHNAQVSLLTGMAAARLMLDAGTGILRGQPPPDERSLARLRRQARALGIDWPRPSRTPSSCAASTPRPPPTRPSCTRRPASGAAPATPSSTASRPPAPSTSRSPRPTPTRPRRCAACRTASCPSAAWRRAPKRRCRTGCAPASRPCPARWRRAGAAPAPSSAASSTSSRRSCSPTARASASTRS
jgi:hypothetical protein